MIGRLRVNFLSFVIRFSRGEEAPMVYEVWNFQVRKSSYETQLRKMTSHFYQY